MRALFGARCLVEAALLQHPVTVPPVDLSTRVPYALRGSLVVYGACLTVAVFLLPYLPIARVPLADVPHPDWFVAQPGCRCGTAVPALTAHWQADLELLLQSCQTCAGAFSVQQTSKVNHLVWTEQCYMYDSSTVGASKQHHTYPYGSWVPPTWWYCHLRVYFSDHVTCGPVDTISSWAVGSALSRRAGGQGAAMLWVCTTGCQLGDGLPTHWQREWQH